jgi:hypothetical protein
MVKGNASAKAKFSNLSIRVYWYFKVLLTTQETPSSLYCKRQNTFEDSDRLLTKP